MELLNVEDGDDDEYGRDALLSRASVKTMRTAGSVTITFHGDTIQGASKQMSSTESINKVRATTVITIQPAKQNSNSNQLHDTSSKPHDTSSKPHDTSSKPHDTSSKPHDNSSSKTHNTNSNNTPKTPTSSSHRLLAVKLDPNPRPTLNTHRPWEPPPLAPQPSRPPTVYFGEATVLVSREPVVMTCPFCHSSMSTTVKFSNGRRVWTIAFILCVVGWCIGLCLLPFCVTRLKDVEHYCSSCRKQLGRTQPQDLSL